MKPINLERLSDQKIQNALDILASNVQNAMDISHISLNDLQIRINLLGSKTLQPLLDAKTTSTYYKFMQISKGIYDINENNEEFIIFIRSLLRGVSVL